MHDEPGTVQRRKPSRLVALAVIVLSCAPALARAAFDPPITTTDVTSAVSYRHQLTEADTYLDAEDFAAAAAIYAGLCPTFPQNGLLWRNRAVCDYQLQVYGAAADEYQRAVELGVPFPAILLYNAACCQALAGQPDLALVTLERALAAGFEDRPLLLEDTDLASLHDLPRWPEVAGLLPDDEIDRVVGWRTDLDFWVKEVKRLHPAPFAVVHEAEFMARVDRLRQRIPVLDDEQIVAEFVKLATLLGDGHSGIRPLPKARVGLRRLPLQLYAFADGLFVIDADSTHAELLGAEILAIGSRQVADMWPELSTIVPRDNSMRILQQGPFLLTLTAVLRDLGALGETEAVPLHIRDAGGVERVVTVESCPLGRANFELIPSRLPGAPTPPLYLAHADEVLWMGTLDGGHVLYVEFNVVRDAPNESIAAFAVRLKERITAHPEIDTIVMDVRHNGGGNSFLYPPLVKALVFFQGLRGDARLYVLIGRQTFSACQNFVTDLDTWTDAIFAGEPSGSRPNMIGESTYCVLPYSGLRAGISSRYHQESYPGDDRPWIAPSLPIMLDSQDYFANRDPVLDAVLADLNSGR